MSSHTRASQSNLTSISSSARRVRFQLDEPDQYGNPLESNNARYTRSSDDVRLTQANLIHRVEFQIPIQQGIRSSLDARLYRNAPSSSSPIQDRHPWFTVDCSSPFPADAARTRSLTSQKIDMNYSNNNHHHRPNAIHANVVASPPIEIQTTAANSSTVSSRAMFSRRDPSYSHYEHVHVARSVEALMDWSDEQR